MEPDSQASPQSVGELNQNHKNKRNPRRMSREDAAALKASIIKFGDLSCIVYNQASKQLVGGHQRIEIMNAIQSGAGVTITQRFAEPNRQGTVAVGVINIEGEDFKYRVVNWPLDATDENGTQYSSFEIAANVAANRIQGEFDQEVLAEWDYELSKLENGEELLALTGQQPDEIEKLLKSAGIGDAEDEPEVDETEANKLEFALTREQREIVEEAINHIVATRDMAAETNRSKNGNALYFLAKDHLERLHNQAEPEQPTNDAEAPTV